MNLISLLYNQDMQSKEKSFFEYTNYRELMKVLIENRKAAGKSFSYRWYSQKAGYNSPNFLQLILDGKRNLTNDGVERFCNVFQLDKREKTYLRILVQFNQAKTNEEKDALAKDLINFLGRSDQYLLKMEQYNYYAKWYFIPIRELIASSGSALDIDEIGSRLRPTIVRSQVEEAIKSLLHLGMIHQEDDKFYVTDNLVTTGDEISATAVTQYHLNMLRLAGESISRFPREEREISSVTLSLTREKALEAKKLTQEFRKKLWTLETEETDREVYQINFQLFPMTAKARPGGKK
jgi:uncharacterized protein (TIGR02147 family)